MILSKIKDVLEYKGWRYFNSGFYNLNIIGIRSDERQAGKFDDLMVVAYKDPIDGEVFTAIKCTTDAGLHWLKAPFVKSGTAILLPNQYRGAYKLGIHGRTWKSGGYQALEQQVPMEYIRDNNRDDVLDVPRFKVTETPADQLRLQGKTIYNGNLKTNIHRTNLGITPSLVGRASAGCQVIQKSADFNWLINVVKKSIGSGWRNSFTYTLIHESWLREV
jgi:hypothetical protein